MSSGYVEIDEITDSFATGISIGLIGDQLVLTVDDGDNETQVFLDAEQRDRFAKAWAEAERRAEAHGAVT